MNYTISSLTANVPGFPVDCMRFSRRNFSGNFHLDEVIPDSNISSLSNTTLEGIFAYIYFTNINASCNNPASIPDQVEYTLRMQE